MVSQEIHFFDGEVFHKRAGSKHHEFNYKYRSLYLTDVYDFKAQEPRLPQGAFWSYRSIQPEGFSKIRIKINNFCIKNNAKKVMRQFMNNYTWHIKNRS